MAFDPTTAKLTQAAPGSFDPSTAKLFAPAASPAKAASPPAPSKPSWLESAFGPNSAVYAGARGVVTGALGAPGDLEQLLTQEVPSLWGQKPSTAGPWHTGTVFPTSQTISQGLSKLDAFPAQGHPYASGIGNFVGGMLMPAEGVGETASALKNSGLLTRALGGTPASLEAETAIKEAQKLGYKVPPSAATGHSQIVQDLTNFGVSKSAGANRQILDSSLKRAMGIPATQAIGSTSLQEASQAIPARFVSQITGKTVSVSPELANNVRNLIASKPQFAAEIAGDPAIKTIEQGMDSGKVDAGAWFNALKRLKQMQYSSSNTLDKEALRELISTTEKPILDMSPRVARSYRVFNRQWRALATAVNSTEGDQAFLQTGKLSPHGMYKELESSTKSPSGLLGVQNSPKRLEATVRRARMLDLVRPGNVSNESSMLNVPIAAAKQMGLTGDLGAYSQNSALKTLIAKGTGPALRTYFDSGAGQAAMLGARPLTPAEIAILKTLPKGAAAYQNYESQP